MSESASYPQKIAALIEQASERHAPIICPICGRPILPGQKVAFDHRQAKARGGANTVANLRCVHDEPEGEFACHAIKTNGGSAKATTRGTDNYEAKKTDRMIREGTGVVTKREPGEPKPPSRWQSRGFDKTFKRPMDPRKRPVRRTIEEPAT